MTTARIENESRRRFLQGTAGLTLAIYLPVSGAAATGKKAAMSFEPNAFLRIAEDNTVTVISKHLEMGQGTYTGLATIVAEELDADWSQVRVESAPADAKRYNNLFWGEAQGTGGSTAMANSWDQLRHAGASARAMLVSAAAQQWKVPAAEIRVSNGTVTHPGSGKKASFGQLARAASDEAAPASVKLKDPKDFTLVGKRIPRKDSVAKTTGKAVFTQDIHLPGMLTAVVAHAPRFGAQVKSFDATRAKAVKGVVNVVQIPSGVAVLAKDTWSAKKGRDALSVEWDESNAFQLGSEQIMAKYQELAKSPGKVAASNGDADAALSKAARTFDAAYDFPYLAHAAMEPMNCVIRLGKDGCEVWNGEQMQTVDQAVLAKLFGLDMDKVRIRALCVKMKLDKK
ncbi:molybdopterin cofactor-binding domain-containing protein [Noviherbaspirillum denitrificans]|uniref:molybdopterin cofactor-binding domain-containing protein n=1 Tax=Noviherbaspirillum denitrificans TaxID=1968433 RepID=UPI000B537832